MALKDYYEALRLKPDFLRARRYSWRAEKEAGLPQGRLGAGR